MVLGITPNTKFVYSLTARVEFARAVFLSKKGMEKKEDLWYHR